MVSTSCRYIAKTGVPLLDCQEALWHAEWSCLMRTELATVQTAIDSRMLPFPVEFIKWSLSETLRYHCVITAFISIYYSPDADPPVISGCPSDIVLSLPPGQSCVTAAWTSPTATDVSPPVTSVSNFDQTFCFPQGQNEVTYIFSDSFGNSDTCSFLVIVSPPVGK